MKNRGNGILKKMRIGFRHMILTIVISLGLAAAGLCIPDLAVKADAAGSASDIINVAKSQVGTSGVPNKYTYWYGTSGGSYSYAWCHAFVSWCAEQAGCKNLIPKTASCKDGVNWFKGKNQWKSRTSGYVPQPGDLIYFDWSSNGYGGYDHVGIVNYVSGGNVYTIEGNAKNAVKLNGGYANGYALTNPQILGYGVPEYNLKNTSPQGYVDIIEGRTGSIHIRGWAFDMDSPMQALEIHTYVGNTPYVRVANQTRTDVGAKYPGTGNNHGFDYVIPVKESGSQKVSIYAINVGSGSNALIEAGEKTVNITKDASKPVVSNVKVSNITKDGYTVSCTVTDNIEVDRVQFPTWTTDNGQDDLQWYTGTKSGTTYTYRVNSSKHNNKEGYYRTHIYAYDKADNCTVVTVDDVYIDHTAPVISNIRVTNIDYTGYTVSCKVTDKAGIDRVQFPVWTANAGQDDLVTDWVTSKRVSGTKSGDTYTFRVKTSDHKNESGKYETHIYAYDKLGNHNAEGVIVSSVMVPSYIHASGVSLNVNSLTLNAGESRSLSATVSPTNATNKDVTWNSSNQGVAKVDSSGKITAVGGGSATITVKTIDGGKTASCTVKVNAKIPVTGLSVQPHAVTLTKIGETVTAKAIIAPTNATDQSLIWQTSDAGVARVNQGAIVAVGNGNATITVMTKDTKVRATCNVTVNTTDGKRKDPSDTHIEEALPGQPSLPSGFRPDNPGGSYMPAEPDAPAKPNTPAGSDMPAQSDTPARPGQHTEPVNPAVPAVPGGAAESVNLPKLQAGRMIGDKKSGGMFKTAADGISFVYTKPLNKNKSSVVIPDTVMVDGARYKVTAIAANAFKNNKKLTKVVIGRNITVIEKNAFANCKKLKTVSGGQNVAVIGDAAFSGCTKLRKITFGSALNTIGKRAFYKCSALTSITLPSSLQGIGSQAFAGCTKLKNLTIKTQLLNSGNTGSHVFQGVSKKIKIKYPKGMQEDYRKLLGLYR